MKKALPFLAIIASIVVVLAAIYAFVKKPKIVLDANGFPLNPKEGDTFTKDGKVYTFTSGVWLVEQGPPGGGPGGEPEGKSGQRQKGIVNGLIAEIKSAQQSGDVSNQTAACNKLAALCANDNSQWCWDWYDKVCGGSAAKGQNCPDWSYEKTMPLVPIGAVPPINISFQTKRKCEPCIRFRGYVYLLISSQGHICEYKRQ